MTPTHAPAPPITRRSGRDVIRGLLAVIALTAFVVGVPVALLTVAPMSIPQNPPTWGTVIEAMTRPDDGNLLQGGIQVIAWVAWAAFTISVITELAAAGRHVSTPHLPLLGGTQRLAATLVTTAGLLLTTSSSLTPTATASEPAPASAPGALTEVPLHMAPAERADRSPSPALPTVHHVAGAESGPTITVQRGDTLWALAERHLGDGHRYTEILTLNQGHPQADGRALDDAHWIYPGWQLHLPHDAVISPPPTAPAAPSGATTHVVQRDDTLWEIASERLGDPSRYPEIVALNQGTPQPDGDTLTDPDLIRPGWTLALPVPATASTGDPLPTTGTPPRVDEPSASDAGTSDVVPSDDATPPGDDGTPPSDDATVPADDAALRADDETPGTDDASSTGEQDPSEAIDTADDTDDPASTHAFVLGLTALAAAGVIGELARRRKLQQRARRVGQRIPLPAAGSPANEAERTLREAAPPMTIAALKQALLNLASRCYTTERDLPRLAAITLTPTDLVLHLSEDDPDPVEPFTATDAHTWTAPHAALVDDPAIDDPDRPEPFPALVTLGHTTDGTVLLNLEAAGTLTLTGDPGTAADVLRALVAELATSDLTGRIGLVTGPEFTPLAAACDPARLQVATPESLAAQLTQRSRDVERALGGTAAEDTLQARSDRIVGDVWLPVVYVTTTHSPASSAWSGSTVIGLGEATHGGWTLNVDDDQATLDQLGLTYQPQRLTPAHLETLADLLATAAAPDDPEQASAAPDITDEITDALTALPTPTPAAQRDVVSTTAPVRINVLGPITIEGLPPGDDAHLSRRSTELLVYLALRGQATGPELDEALWHGRRIDNQTRNSLIYRARQRVGADVLPVVGPDGIYRLGPDVASDWSQFQALAHRGLTGGPAGTADLQAALDLVRDRPLLGIRDQDYTWAEHDIQHMISTISDVAHVLARRWTSAGRPRAALDAATKGLRADGCSGALASDAITAAESLGDPAELDRLTARLVASMADVDPDAGLPWATATSGRYA